MAKKSKNNTTIFVVLGVVALLILGYMALGQNISGNDNGSTNPATCGVPTGILTVNELSAITGGTAPSSSTITAGIDGGAVATSVTSGTTTFPVGAEVVILVSKSDYIDRSFAFTM